MTRHLAALFVFGRYFLNVFNLKELVLKPWEGTILVAKIEIKPKIGNDIVGTCCSFYFPD